jgi:hypothetical protein
MRWGHEPQPSEDEHENEDEDEIDKVDDEVRDKVGLIGAGSRG